MVRGHESEETRFVEKLSKFVHSARYYLVGLLVLFVLAVGVYFVYSEIQKGTREKTTILIEKAQERYLLWQAAEDETEKVELEEALLQELDSLIDGYGRQYAAQRALFIKGSLYYAKELWSEASAVLTDLADRFPKSYLSQEALFLSGICLEELGDPDGALGLYTRLTDDYPKTPRMPHALFSQGRLLEARGAVEEALRIYNVLKLDYSFSNWTKLAVNRIIDIEAGRMP